jgi:hypothetical protein
LLLVFSIPLVLWSPVSWEAKFISTLGVILAVLYFLDITFFCYYQLTPQGLIIGSQIRSYLIPYRTMVKIEPGNFWNLISFYHQKRFALSSRNMKITLSRGIWRRITISPADPEHFTTALLNHIDRERSSRITHTRTS